MAISVKDAIGATQTINTLPATGQANSAGSLPVTLASDQSPVPVSGTITDAQLRASAVPVSVASLPLASGAATAAKQDSQALAIAALALESGGNLADILTTLQAGLSATLTAGEVHIGSVSGQSAVVSASYTRPADTDYYTALDVLANSTSAPALLTFANIARINAGSGYIVKARLVTDQSSNAARFRLHLYNAAITPINDNAPFTQLFANCSVKIGHIDFDAMATEAGGSDCAEAYNFSTRLKFTCASASRALYGLLETRDSFTPTSGQVVYVELAAEVD